MTVDIPYAVIVAVAVEAACIAVGAVIGIGVTLVRIWGERRG